MEDPEFVELLQALTGQKELWEGYDPTTVHSTDPEGEDVTNRSPGSEITDNDASTPEKQPASGDLNRPSTDPDDNMDSLSLEGSPQRYNYKLNKARAAACEPEVHRDASELEKAGLSWPETGLQEGEVSAIGELFCPWRLVKDYPHMYVGKRNGERAKPLFAKEAIHQNRVWDVYYLHFPRSVGKKPIIFVPTYQLQHLLDVVNRKLNTKLTIPSGVNYEKFSMRFGDHGTPRPRFLGRSTGSMHFASLCQSIPEPQDDEGLEDVSHLIREDFVERLQDINRNRKMKNSGEKAEKKRRLRAQNHKAWGRAIKRVQRYLALRKRIGDATASADPQDLIDLGLPLAAEPEGSVVFVAVDIEAYEFDHNLVTEVGIATLDTASIAQVASGPGGENWFPLIQARHIRIKENAWAKNTRHVRGCADYFDFGTSEFVHSDNVIPIVKEILGPLDNSGKKRPIVLVFHDAGQDIKYLRVLGHDIYQNENILEIIDTKEMHQSIVRHRDSTSLQNVLNYLDIPWQHLHNAGNDAVYTLRAMVGLAVKKRLMSLEKAALPKETVKTKKQAPNGEGAEDEGWSSNGEDTDGGEPVRPSNPAVDSDEGQMGASLPLDNILSEPQSDTDALTPGSF
ncbi:good for full DBP5 activity protein 2 [Diplogelasinospora grovesii]|uniref:Good for full DBP5 activity protein 2 n=1 Tax=Diplogelasinospora grovesii TaxID=303347 RepID=A0AAN6NF37_9PEZI|nr:good for full DBP5 activity protein 2 [Diplogelasinospora grovesii]